MYTHSLSLRSLTFTLLASFVLFASPLLASAQARVGITITPPTTEDRVDPGQVFEYSLKVENQGDGVEILYPKLRDITGIADDGQPVFATGADTREYELSSWVSFDKEMLTIPAKGSTVLGVTVRVPSSVTPGAHIGSVAFTRDAPSVTQGSGVGYEVRSILSLRVSGEVIERTRVREFFADHMFFKKPDVRFTITIENEGNVFSRPKGFIDITNMWGDKVETLAVNEGGASVFPKSDRKYTAGWKSEDFHFGKYTAEMTLTVEGAQGFQSLLSTVEFWVVPTDIILPILGGLLFVLIVFWIFLRLYVKKQIARATGGRVTQRQKEATAVSRLSIVVIALLFSVILGLIFLLFLLG